MAGWTDKHTVAAAERNGKAIQDRREDLAWMAQWYETPKGAAMRLGMGQKSLERWCMRHAPDIWAHLQDNQTRRKVS